MGRSPCCDKVGLKKGPWTVEEDQKLLAYIVEHGHGRWRALPDRAGLQRCGKSCRLRWTNYLRPDIKRGKFSVQEEQTIIQLHALLGNRWSAIATHLQKRTDNEIKNYWNTHLKKRLARMGIDPVTHKHKSVDPLGSAADGHSKADANLSHMAQWESARLEAEARLARESKLRPPSASLELQHHQLVGPSSSAQLHGKPTPAPCLDVLRAWQGVWSNPTGGGCRIDLESPTSTLSFSESTPPVIAGTGLMGGQGVEERERGEVGWKCFGKPMLRVSADKDRADDFLGLSDTAIFDGDAPWLSEPPCNGAGATSWGFETGFAGMLPKNLDNHNSSEGYCQSDNVEGGSCVEGEQEDVDYWSSIFNLVNSLSPSP